MGPKIKLFRFISLLLITTIHSKFMKNPEAISPWLTLPATPSLPGPISTTTQKVNGVELWYQEYNKSSEKVPIVLEHGGLGYSAHFGGVIKELIKEKCYVITIDRRGHGRSTFNDDDVFTYDMFAKDIHDHLELINVKKYNVVGWSDGSATTLAALQNPIFEAKINKAFIFAGFMVPEDTNPNFERSKIYIDLISRCQKEYQAIQPKKDFGGLAKKLVRLGSQEPQFTKEGLGRIDGSKVTIVGAKYDEVVNLDVPARLNSAISGSKLVMLDGVSHFAPLQDPKQFAREILVSLA